MQHASFSNQLWLLSVVHIWQLLSGCGRFYNFYRQQHTRYMQIVDERFGQCSECMQWSNLADCVASADGCQCLYCRESEWYELWWCVGECVTCECAETIVVRSSKRVVTLTGRQRQCAEESTESLSSEYTVSQKNDTDVAHYNFNTHQPTLVSFWQRRYWDIMLSSGGLLSHLSYLVSLH